MIGGMGKNPWNQYEREARRALIFRYTSNVGLALLGVAVVAALVWVFVLA